MNFFVLFALAIGLSMDAFAVSICLGLSAGKAIAKRMLIAGLYFGIFQAGMPLIGYVAASNFAEMINAFDHWIAFVLLAFIGGKMIYGSFKKDDDTKKEVSVGPKYMLPLAVATSIDALAVGVSLAFLQVNIVMAALFIGITTFTLSAAGVIIGNIFGAKLRSKAEFLGGIILVLIGTNTLLEHLGIIKF